MYVYMHVCICARVCVCVYGYIKETFFIGNFFYRISGGRGSAPTKLFLWGLEPSSPHIVGTADKDKNLMRNQAFV